MAQSQQKRFFISGASGYIGSVITEFAIAQGHQVHGLTRSESGAEKLCALGATPVVGDLTSLAIIRDQSALADVVINLACAMSPGTQNYDQVMHIDNAALDAMAEGLGGSGKPLVTTAGTLYAAADPEGGEVTEDSPDERSSWNTRVKNESYALSLAKKHGVCVTSIRLAPFIYGRGASGVALFMKGAAHAGAAPIVDGGLKPNAYLHVDDAARLYLAAAEKGQAGEKYNGSSGWVTARELHGAIAQTINVPVEDKPFAEVEKTHGLLAHFLAAGNKPSNDKARKEVGWEPREIGIIEDIKTGSYQELANSLRKSG